jgi:hypothetical protein
VAKIDELKILADKIAELLNGVEDTEINHNECGTLIRFDNVEFGYDEKGKSEGLTVSL